MASALPRSGGPERTRNVVDAVVILRERVGEDGPVRTYFPPGAPLRRGGVDLN